MRRVLITGASSGFGYESAILFASKGWRVAATVRRKESFAKFASIPNITPYLLDVTKEAQVKKIVQKVISDFGSLDVVVNNAGYGLGGAFETTDSSLIRKQFDTNVFGMMSMTRAVLPHFRKRKSGVIINIASIGGRMSFPLYSAYHASKWAVEGFSESLHFELRQFGIRVKIIEPGVIKTDFYSRSQVIAKKKGLTDYDLYSNRVFASYDNAEKTAPGPKVVAEAIYQAATDDSSRMRYPVGNRAPLLMFLRRILSDRLYLRMIRRIAEKK